jgi:hypothetical protein
LESDGKYFLVVAATYYMFLFIFAQNLLHLSQCIESEVLWIFREVFDFEKGVSLNDLVTDWFRHYVCKFGIELLQFRLSVQESPLYFIRMLLLVRV